MQGFIVDSEQVKWDGDRTLTDIEIEEQRKTLEEMRRATYVLQCPPQEKTFYERKKLSPKEFAYSKHFKHKRR